MFPFCPTSLAPQRTESHVNTLMVFGVWLNADDLRHQHPSSALPPHGLTSKPIPKYISGRTSYLQVRLAFYLQPQVIRATCNSYRFGPPSDFRSEFTLPMVSSPGFGSSVLTTKSPYSDSLSLRLRHDDGLSLQVHE